MLYVCKKAVGDILANRFLNTVTIITIALAVLIVSTFTLFFINANAFMTFWTKEIRMMAYLKSDVSEKEISELQDKIKKMQGVEDIRFISKQEALDRFKENSKRQTALFENIQENPLPDAFEIRMAASFQKPEQFEVLAVKIENLSLIEDVEYGQQWLGRFTSIMSLFKLAGYAMSCLFFMAAVFFVANTIRLVFYSRKDEVEIMRLVGATESFIRTPFYIQSIIQGALGGIIGLGILFFAFNVITGKWNLQIGTWQLNMNFEFPIPDFHMSFLPHDILTGILAGSIFLGWLGCYLSLRQFLK